MPTLDCGAGSRARSRELRLAGPYDLARSLGPLCHGRRDPTVRIEGRTLWRATRTAAGPATEAVVVDPAGATVAAWAWGPGADLVLDALPQLIGDDPTGFTTQACADPGAHRPPAGRSSPTWPGGGKGCGSRGPGPSSRPASPPSSNRR